MSAPLPPLIRVARKRSADPQSALFVSLKRRRADPLLFSLHSTQETPNAPVPNAKVIDYTRSEQTSSVLVDETAAPENLAGPLAELMDAVGEVGGAPTVSEVQREVITMNGRPLIVCGENDLAGDLEREDDFVYDFYEMRKGDAVDAEEQDLEMRFASKEEFDLWMGSATDSESDASDDDSNDENNWRNDYPDEESCSDDDSDTYSDDSELGVSGEGWEGIGMHRLRIDDNGSDVHDVYGNDDSDAD